MSWISVSGQSEAQVSQYMFGMEAYNPSAIGLTNEINLFALFRQQWVGIPNAPQTVYAAANTPIKFLDRDCGVGIVFYNDNAGIFKNSSVNAQFSCRFKLYDGFVRLGSNLGYVGQTIYGDSVRQITSDYHDIQGDLSIPKQTVNGSSIDVGLGAYYEYNDLSLGLSVLHLFEPTISLDDYVASFVDRTMFFYGSYKYSMPNSRYVLKPSFLLKTDFVSMQTDVSAYLEKDERYWAGLSWRYQDAVVFLVGMNLMQGLTLGYSYDLSTSKFISNSGGSHELFLRYRFSLGKKKINKYKSVRIL